MHPTEGQALILTYTLYTADTCLRVGLRDWWLVNVPIRSWLEIVKKMNDSLTPNRPEREREGEGPLGSTHGSDDVILFNSPD